MSGATNEVSALAGKIDAPEELVLTPRAILKPGSWTRGHRSDRAYHFYQNSRVVRIELTDRP